ncbi:helix-turn-helix transcriptional regulator [Vibrio sp. S4M6]|uniref:helix-turn-helix domain-containing protein n=1 Tax=Vibrio sinus TaxID=2946865 RepID=UPI00202AC148|nr:helix-turn-helix transcriptional regulator [Vibrio sinus]MCL9780680.1 helix-turn-helix transcriptional regulator [Vibrio sinus]
MTIEINLDVMLAKRKMRSKALAQAIGITEANLSVLKNGKAKAIRLSTLDKLCEVLECQPADLLEFRPNTDD